jgi:hypothetical protein
MDHWAAAGEGRSSDVFSGKPHGRGLLGLAGLCAALWALLVTNVLDTGAPQPLLLRGGGGTGGAAATGCGLGAPYVDALVRVAGLDAGALAAALNVTIAACPALAAAAGAAAGGHATLLLELAGGTHAVAWPPPRGGAALSLAVPAAEVVPQRLRPFDAYRLRLGPAAAVLRTCSGSSGGGAHEPEEQEECLNVALPLRLAVAARAPAGLKLSARPPRGAAAAADGDGASADDVLVTRATSTRVLRLMAVMLQWVFATYAVAWAVGSVMARYVLGRCFGRLHHGLLG